MNKETEKNVIVTYQMGNSDIFENVSDVYVNSKGTPLLVITEPRGEDDTYSCVFKHNIPIANIRNWYVATDYKKNPSFDEQLQKSLKKAQISSRG